MLVKIIAWAQQNVGSEAKSRNAGSVISNLAEAKHMVDRGSRDRRHSQGGNEIVAAEAVAPAKDR